MKSVASKKNKKSPLKRKETIFEKVLTHSHKKEMIFYINQHANSFEEAIKLSLAHKPPYSWRAAWLLWGCMKKNDSRIQKHVKSFICILPKIKDNQKREILKILEKMNIPEKLEGLLYSHCATIWVEVNHQPSVRFYALKSLIKTAQKYPELSAEVVLLTQNQYTETLTAGIYKSVKKMLLKIKK
ncbi:hypothetical protein FLAV_00677 [Flavobacteriales bacterium]|nr:hypothetical protein [Flavobacteriales bacterium]WKZ74973.1 MAG: hypothetical protein QY303_12590 [Vicingaceae bacterium]GIK69915.1 MAG: hypothetical protein BroJett020_12100 [Bacteroidota bacterium]CAG0960536.1 hypothetical protein FLAV_00677 [Flavobacteriales bacterium]